ncbi:MAG TPA: transporter [Terriglobales bacterium]|nr:transporter [Terriglobales bacterium]
MTVVVAAFCLSLLRAQDLAPRAYIITPVHSNAVTLTSSFLDGGLQFEGVVPITDATAKVNVSVLTLYHALRFFGRSANITASLPYGVGNFHGTVLGSETNAYRSGLLDSTYRFSVNLLGGPAMDTRDFIQWQQKRLLGVSLKVVAPTGQYDPTKLLNYGGNRWAFRPEIGLSQRWSHWVLDTYGAVWFFTVNPEFFSRNQYNPGVTSQSEKPVGAFEAHLSYDVKPRLWASADVNFWYGGQTSLNGVENQLTLQKNSRVGGTLSVPVSKHHSLKFSYANGAYIRFGGNYQSVSVAWQYSWVGRPN